MKFISTKEKVFGLKEEVLLGEGVVNKVDGSPLSFWVGTQEDLDLTLPKDENTLYLVKEATL